MRHSDRRLTDKIYTDENLLGTWAAFDALPNYVERASLIASLVLGAKSQIVTSSVTESSDGKAQKAIATKGESRVFALSDAKGHVNENGGSGGARTRNLCRDRAAL
jgi:hypothetical protein